MAAHSSKFWDAPDGADAETSSVEDDSCYISRLYSTAKPMFSKDTLS